MRILVDEDLPRAVADLLRRLGHEAKHVREQGLGGKPDKAIFDAAQQHKSVLMTADLDFGNIVSYPLETHCGIVVLRFPEYFRRTEIVNLVSRFIEDIAEQSITGALVIVEPGAYRVRRT